MSEAHPTEATGKIRVDVRDLSFFYGESKALKNISLPLYDRKVTAFIGPSGCGKSTLLRVLNRIYALYPSQHAEGEVLLDGENVLDPKQDLNLLRARIGMVFQKPTPFPMSIYDNIAFGMKLYERMSKSEMDGRVAQRAETRSAVERSERQAQRLWLQSFRRPAAAPVHRPHGGDQARSDLAGRTVFGARSDLYGQDRGTDRRIVRANTPSSSSPITCSRQAARRTTPPLCIWASWSNMARPKKSSPRPTTNAPKIILRAASARRNQMPWLRLGAAFLRAR